MDSKGLSPIVSVTVLASSSSGNCTLICSGRTRLLVDAGLSRKETFERIKALGVEPASLTAILITHEHSDHIAGLPVLAKKRNGVQLPIYISQLTAPAVPWGDCEPILETFQAGASFTIGDIDVTSFTIPHDAADPVGYSFRTEGIKISIATDLGYLPDSVRVHLRGSDLLMLESNHDLEMLKVGPYPWAIKQRVMSRVGHLSNLVMSDYLMQDLDSCTANVVLGHLSEQNNHPEIVRMIASQTLEERGIGAQITIAEQKAPSAVFRY